MNLDEYRRRGKEMVDYIADYLETIRERRVFPSVHPGYMKAMIPDSAPIEGEDFSEIMKDVERVIMPGVTHWQSPHMHAYFPALSCPASLLGDMLADGINCLGFTWASSPACTELEIIVTDWLAKMIGLPKEFMHLAPNSTGGGVIQTTSCEATFIALLAARKEAIRRLKEMYKFRDESEINNRLVAYTSDQAHSSVEKAGLMGLVKMRFIETDSNLSLRADRLLAAVVHDKEKGLIPFFLCATLGTTGGCAFDNLQEIGPICVREKIWLHIDSAYAGTAFICPEFRKWMKGVEFAESFAFNPSKWMMVHFDCTTMWLKNSAALHRTFCVDPLYLKHENSGLAVDFMHWQIPLSKRFRALKLWFVIRNYGVKGLQEHIRKNVELAKIFEIKVRADPRFEVPAERHLGMVVFRIKGDNELTEDLLKKLNASGKLHCVPAKLKEKYVIRFTVTSPNTTVADIERDWQLIKEFTEMLLPSRPRRRNIPLGEIRKKNPHFGSSLLLSNTTMIPRVINGSFVAMAPQTEEARDFLRQYDQTLKEMAKSSPVLHGKIVKKFLTPDRQLSLDSRMDLMDLVVNVTDPGVKTTESKARASCGTLPSDLKSPYGVLDAETGQASCKNSVTHAELPNEEDEDYYNLLNDL